MTDGQLLMCALVGSLVFACAVLLLEELLCWVWFGSDAEEGSSRG